MSIDRYLGGQLFVGTALALAAILAVLSLVDFMNEFDDINASYTLMSVIQYIGLTMAGRVYEMLPVAVLIGSLLSFGNLAAQSELIALRAVGYSTHRIIFSAVGVSVLFAVLVALIGELLIPQAEFAALKIRNEDNRAGVFQQLEVGIWSREGNYFIHAGTVDESNRYHDVSIYELDEDRYLQRVITASSLKIESNRLLLQEVREASLGEESVVLQSSPQLMIERVAELDENAFGAIVPEAMSAAALIKQIDFLKLSSVRSDFYELALWSKLSQPLSVLVMLLLALPYVFSPVRSSGGQRLFYGILIGLAYALLNKNLGNAALAFDFSPALGAFAPLLLGSMFGLYRLKSMAGIDRT